MHVEGLARLPGLFARESQLGARGQHVAQSDGCFQAREGGAEAEIRNRELLADDEFPSLELAVEHLRRALEALRTLCQRGRVGHAMRVTVVKTRRAYVYPARHFASKRTDKDLPRMGERLRLRKDFDVSGFSPEAQAILKGLKKPCDCPAFGKQCTPQNPLGATMVSAEGACAAYHAYGRHLEPQAQGLLSLGLAREGDSR